MEVNAAHKVAPPRRRRWWLYLLVALIVISLAYMAAFLLIAGLGGLSTGHGGDIALIKIDGPISAAGSEGLLAASISAEDIMGRLRRAADDDNVAAVLLRINSPGGTAAAGQEIYLEVKKLRKKKPVVVSIGDVGASAAYLLASPANVIMAAPSSLVGSIGTIITIPNYQGLFKKLGINYTIIHQGKYKDIGNPARPLTKAEKDILDRQSKVVYEQFIDDVAAGRGMSRRKVARLATGLAFLGVKGKKLGLVDKIGNFQDAIDLAAKLGKIEGKPGIVEYGGASVFQIFSQLFSSEKNILRNQLLTNLISSPPAASVK